jgi:phosphoadenosine phosphosulfate reductase
VTFFCCRKKVTEIIYFQEITCSGSIFCFFSLAEKKSQQSFIFATEVKNFSGMEKDKIKELNEKCKGKQAQEIINLALDTFKNKIALASSLGAEDQVLTHMLIQADRTARIFTLDTGRMFPESYDLLERTKNHYNINIEIFFPDYLQVENMVNEKGINLFYHSIENRKLCCGIRKIEPLKRAFAGLNAWICGLRREQSITRFNIDAVEWDEGNRLVKINPLADWTTRQVWDYIKSNDIPYHALHDKGYPSIGCQPCTRAVKPGEDVRAGRWWWEEPEKKECGLHGRSGSQKE